jgi:hypothetical protein
VLAELHGIARPEDTRSDGAVPTYLDQGLR